VQAVARTATLAAVRRLDDERRGLAVKFLAEARLLQRRGVKVNLAAAVCAAQHCEMRHSLVTIYGARTCAMRTLRGADPAVRTC
jgi:hypothetical protein